MKTVFLTDDDVTFNAIKSRIENKRYITIDSTKPNKKNEFSYLFESILGFSKSDYEILLVRFSGNEDIRIELGDESPEMIISISYNNANEYYVENPEGVFSHLITV